MKLTNLKSKHLYRQLTILSSILFFLWIIIIYLIVVKNENRKNIYLNAELKSFSSKITSILGSYENFSNYLFYENRHKLEVQSIIKEAYNSDEKRKSQLATELKTALNDDYMGLKGYGFGQVNFMFPTGESFVNFSFKESENNPEIYESAKIANVEKKFLRSFAEGNFYDGYRFVYLMTYQNDFIGTVEVSIPLTNLIRIFSNFYPDINVHYLVKSSLVKNSSISGEKLKQDAFPLLFKNYTSYYSIKNNKVLRDKSEYSFFKKIDKQVNRKMKSDKGFGLMSDFQGIKYTSLFIPVKGKNNNTTGYLICIYENSQYEKIYENLYTEVIFVNLIILVSLIGAFIFIRDRNKFRELAGSDYLTGLYNRSKFMEFANYELDKSARLNTTFSILLMDIDYFKKINDSYGHNRGDEVLKTTSALIKNSLRKTDILARWGGEEFICLLPDTNLENACFVAEKIREKIENNKFDTVGKLTLSIGVHEKSFKDFTIEEINEKADKALYGAKTSGRNVVKLYEDDFEQFSKNISS